jgi:hypothetical protein
LLLPPRRFIAIASVWCASSEIEPYDIAPVQKRFTISEAGSTSSSGIGSSAKRKRNSPRSVQSRSASSSAAFENSLKVAKARSGSSMRTAC